MGSGRKRKSVGGINTIFAVHSWQKYRKTGSKFANTPGNTVAAGWSLFIKGAGESQRSSPAFTGKCRLVRRRGERAAENAGNTQIRLKYEYEYTKYTRKDKKYTNTKIQTHTNTNLTVGSLSWRRRRRKWDLSSKKSSRKNGRNFWTENKKKVPNVAYEGHLIGEETPLQGWVTQKMLWGGTRAVKIDFLGASTFFGSFHALFFLIHLITNLF